MATKKRKANPPPAPHPTSLLAGSRFQDELFWRGMRLSAGAHALLVIMAIVLGITITREPIKFTPSIRVDLVALPDVIKRDLGKYTPDDMVDLNKKLTEAGKGAKKLLEEAKKKPVPEPKPVPVDDSMALKKESAKAKPKKDELRNAIDRIKALSEIENDVKDKPKPKVAAKGNAISKGNSLTGEQAGDTNAYIGKLQTKLRDNWNLPIWLSNQTNLDAKVVIFLDKAGYVSKTVLAKSSGNKQFDDYCLKTIRMAQPFGPPPDDLIDGGLTLGFPL